MDTRGGGLSESEDSEWNRSTKVKTLNGIGLLRNGGWGLWEEVGMWM